jgi:hypothetical protein
VIIVESHRPHNFLIELLNSVHIPSAHFRARENLALGLVSHFSTVAKSHVAPSSPGDHKFVQQRLKFNTICRKIFCNHSSLGSPLFTKPHFRTANDNMPSSDPPTTQPSTAEALASAQGKGHAAKQSKGKEPAAPADEPKLSGAELKKRAKEEKAARRAQAIAEKGAAAPVVPATPAPQPKTEVQKGAKGQRQHQRGSSTSVEVRNLPVRGSQKVAPGPVPSEPKKEDKTVEFFRHLYKTRTTSIAGVSKDVHPAVLALGLQMSNYTICGSCARLVATLQAFKRVSFFLLSSNLNISSSSPR